MQYWTANELAALRAEYPRILRRTWIERLAAWLLGEVPR